MIQNMSYDRGEQLINETTVGNAIITYFAVGKKKTEILKQKLLI